MRCSDYRLLIPYRRSGELLAEDLHLLNQHLQNCEACSSLATPESADVKIQSLLQNVSVPADLKQNIHEKISRLEHAKTVRRIAQYLLLLGIFATSLFIAYGLYNITRPKLDSEGLAIQNGWEADFSQIPNLFSSWLEQEKLPTDLPFEFDFKYYSAHGFEKMGRAYVPFVKFQSNMTTQPSFAKIYFIRSADVDAKNAIDGEQSSFCTVRKLPGSKGLTYMIVHTGNDTKPFFWPAKPRVD